MLISVAIAANETTDVVIILRTKIEAYAFDLITKMVMWAYMEIK